MDGDTDIAAVAALFADPARAAVLQALSDGRSLPAGELARAARVAPSTASFHLARLCEANLVEVEAWGKHRYYRVSGPEVVEIVESLSVLAPAKEVRSLRQSRAARRVRFARTCYDHLAGYLGVKFTRSLVEGGTLEEVEEGYELTGRGRKFLTDFGVDLSGSRGKARFAPRHVDWSERYHHFAEPLAKYTTERLFEIGWLSRVPKSRAVNLTEEGRKGFEEHFGLILDAEAATAENG